MSNTTRPADQIRDFINRKNLKPTIMVAVIALIVGALFGILVGSHDSVKQTAAVTKPAPTVTVTASAEPVEPTVSVPQECLDALDNADEGFSIAADMIGKYSDGISQVTSNQLTEAYSTIRAIKKLNSQLDDVSPEYVSNKELCRAYGNGSSS